MVPIPSIVIGHRGILFPNQALKEVYNDIVKELEKMNIEETVQPTQPPPNSVVVRISH